MTDSDRTVSQAQVASLAGVARAAVTQWRQRHETFPAPLDGSDDRFDRDAILRWLDQRRIPASRRQAGEVEGTTYGTRARRNLNPPSARPDVLRLLVALRPDVDAVGSAMEYLYFLQCLTFLRLYDRQRWTALTGRVWLDGDAAEARRILRRTVAAVDASLGYPDLLKSSESPPARLRPSTLAPLRKVMQLVAHLGVGDFARLRLLFDRECRGHSDWIFTPPSITGTVAAMLAGHVVDGDVTMYDPFARSGEVLVAMAGAYAGTGAVRLIAESSNLAQLRLAGMSLAAHGTSVELSTPSAGPAGGATYVVANPPFGGKEEFAWLEHCVRSLADDGRAAVLMPYSAGFRHGRKANDLRRRLVQHGQVAAVLTLPARMYPGTAIGADLWLLRPSVGEATPITFIDARSLGRASSTASSVHVFDTVDIARIAEAVASSHDIPGLAALVGPDEIRDHGFVLHPPEYQNRSLAPSPAATALSELEPLLADLGPVPFALGAGEAWPRRRLAELCDIGVGVSHGSLSRARKRAQDAGLTAPVVHPRHLRDGKIRPHDIPSADIAGLERYQLCLDDVLWIRTGAMGQVALVGPGEVGWLPHTNLVRLRVTAIGLLSPAYLLAYLRQPSVRARIEDRSVRTTTTSLNAGTFGDFEISLPSLREQHRILDTLNVIEDQAESFRRRLDVARNAYSMLSRHLLDGSVVVAGGDER